MAYSFGMPRIFSVSSCRGGGHDEGFSIPAQREANKKKALSMGAIVGKEFVDRGASAKSADRPQLQAMLEYVKENADRVDYVIVHKVDRLARNRDDDSDIMRVLRECGVQLVSASESIDDTPSGMLLHGIMSSIAEFYSQNLATEVKKGMGEKVKGGGTIGRAPIGYQNVRYNDEKGREVRTVTLDPERSPLVKMAFEEYATGKWTLVSMTEYLGAIGLTTRPTPKHPSKPLGQTTVESMLKNPYYTGVVKYGGVEYPGSHEPLISRELFETVQAILSTRINGERVREHPHFLKGLLYCRKCKSRMLVTYAKSHTGVVYPYYICAGRHSRKKGSPDCNMRAILIDDVERQVESHLDQYKFDPDDRMLVEAYLDEAINKEQEKYKKELDLLTRKKIKLERNQEKLLESYYNDAIPLTLMKSEQKKITKELAIINSDIHAHNATFEEIRANLSLVLDMLEDCGKTYRMANDGIKRMLLIAMVDRIWIEEDGRIEPEMNNLCKEILRTNNEIKKSAPASADADSIRELFKSGSNFFGQGLNNELLVERRRFKLLTSSLPAKRSIS